jgi:hypothetical protein
MHLPGVGKGLAKGACATAFALGFAVGLVGVCSAQGDGQPIAARGAAGASAAPRASGVGAAAVASADPIANEARTLVPPGANELAEVLVGIVHYTRWAESTSTPVSIQICVDKLDEPTALVIARAFAFDAPVSRHVEIVSRSFASASIDGLLDCRAIFFGGTSSAAWRPMLVELVNHPILTVGYGDDFCSYGGMFCLEPSGSGLRIKANLDSISRSGLRVNPQLLRLTQRERGVR